MKTFNKHLDVEMPFDFYGDSISRMVIKWILENNDSYKLMPVNEDYFDNPFEKDCIRIILSYMRKWLKIDALTLKEELFAEEKYTISEIIDYMADVCNVYVSTWLYPTYFNFLSKKAIKTHTESLKKMSIEKWWDADYTMDQLKSIERFYSQKDPDMDEDLEDFVSKLKDRKEKKNLLLTWYSKFDDKVWFEKWWLCTLAARSSIWKTTLAMQMSQRLAKKWYKIAIYSMEMSKEEMIHKFLSVEAWLSTNVFKTWSVPEFILNQAIEKYKQYGKNLNLFDGATWYKDVERFIKTHMEIDVLVIDYLQLFADFDNIPKWENKSSYIGKITMALKRLAQECNILVIILSQVSRWSDRQEKDEMPRLESMRESWNIEQDSDVVCIVHRKTRDSDESTLFVAKNRHWKIWEIDFEWNGRTHTIEEK